jgi:hypothetical protein
MDESGNSGDSDSDSVFVIAGFISTAERWQAFADAWIAAGLARDIKMAKAMRRASKGKRNICNIVTSLVASHVMGRIECAVDLQDYRRYAKGKVPKECDSPYFWGFHGAVARICRTAMALDYSGGLDLFFDVSKPGEQGERWYDLARMLMPHEYRVMLPASICWKADQDFLPLKSADLLAGLARRDHNGDVSGLEPVISRVNAIGIVQESEPLDAEYFQRIVASPDAFLEGEDFKDWKGRWTEGQT